MTEGKNTLHAEAIFPRSFRKQYPCAVRGEGVWLWDETGKKYLDACGGAAVVTIGHGVGEVVEAIAQQARELSYAHTSQFHTRVAEELAAYLTAKFPRARRERTPALQDSARVFFTSGGSEATETAIKIARQYWLSRGEPQRSVMFSRWHSYHGATLGALAVSGNRRRREAYGPLLPSAKLISACFCYRCPLHLEFPSCELACAHELERAIAETGAGKAAAFICEPMVGATSGAVPPEGYLRTVREICDRHGLLFIADEVMTGAGRTGKYFAVEHWGVVPDIIVAGKGLSSGYAPLGAVLVSEKVWRTIAEGRGSLDHGFTYQGHPPSVAAGLAVQRYIEKHNLVEQARARGEQLAARLERLRKIPEVGDIRGKGLLQTVEFVSDWPSRAPFPVEIGFSERLFERLRERGVLVYPMQGTTGDFSGDHILIAPPFTIAESEMDFLVDQLVAAVAELKAEIRK